MEKIASVHIKHTNFIVSHKNNIVILYTPNTNGFSILDLKTMKDYYKETPKPILNVQITNKTIIIFSTNHHDIYDIKDLNLLTTVVMDGVIFVFQPSKRKIFYFRENELLICEKNSISIKKPYLKYIPLSENLICVIRRSKKNLDDFEILIYKKNRGKIFFKNLSNFFENNFQNLEVPEILDISIRERKVYILLKDRIIGHDLNLYVDYISNFKPSKFKNIKNEIILFDSEKMKLRIIEKNLEKIIFEIEADDFDYNSSKSILIVIKNHNMDIYKKINPLKKSFTLIEQSYVYKEQEDEFDLSDDKFTDF